MAYVGQTILMTFFFLPIFPLGVFISMTGLIFSYWVEKYNLLRFYKRPEMINFEIGKLYFSNFKIAVLLLSVSNFIFHQSNFINNQIFLLLGPIIVVLIITFFPYDHLLDINYIGVEEKDIIQGKYEDFYFKFNFHYDRTNPFTKLQGNLKYVERLKSKNLISDEEYKNYINEINGHSCEVNLIEVYYRNNNDLNEKNRTNLKNKNKRMLSKAKNSSLIQGFKSLFKRSIMTDNGVNVHKTNILNKLSTTMMNVDSGKSEGEEKSPGILRLILNSQKEDCFSNSELILNENQHAKVKKKVKVKLRERPKLESKLTAVPENHGMIEVNYLKSTIDKNESGDESRRESQIKINQQILNEEESKVAL